MTRNVSWLTRSAANVNSGTAMAAATEVSLKSAMKVLLSDGRTIRNMSGSVTSRIRWSRRSPTPSPPRRTRRDGREARPEDLGQVGAAVQREGQHERPDVVEEPIPSARMP